MANPLQHGQHPDADQLNAFMEKALPEHERLAMLAHLAACEGCRDIVFLAQKDLLPEVPVAAEQNSQPWWRVWWRPALVAGTTFACLTLVLVSVERQLVVKNQTRLVNEAKKEASNVPSPSLESPLARVPQPVETPESALAARKSQQSPFQAHDKLSRAVPAQPASRPGGVAGGVAGGILGGIGTGPETATARASAPVPQTTLKMRQQLASQAPQTDTCPTCATVSHVAPPQTNGAAVAGLLSSGGPLRVSIEHGPGADNGLSVLRGTVRDPSGAVIPRATIRLRGLSGQANAGTTSDAAGGFTLASVPPGQYEIEVASAGFVPLTQRIDLQANDVAEIRPVLPLGSAAQTVTVTGAAPALQSESAEVASAITLENTFVSQTALNGTLMALDKHGALFRKRTGDKNWKKIRPKWPGAVVKLSVAAGNAPGEQSASASSFLVTTGAGESWTSVDGRHWKRR